MSHDNVNDNVNDNVKGDMISRDEALKKMTAVLKRIKFVGMGAGIGSITNCVNAMLKAVNDAPAVDAAPVDVEEGMTGSPAAMAYIHSLERHNVELMARIKLGQMLEAQLKRERDAALEDLSNSADACVFCKKINAACRAFEPCGECEFEWRGVPQEGKNG